MKKHLLLLLALTLFSCNRQTDFEKKLIKGQWVFYMEESRSASYYIRFYEDGSYKCFDMFSNIEFIEENANKQSQKWKYQPEEDKLTFFGSEFKVISVEKDTIVRMVKGGTKYSLVNSPNVDGSVDPPLPPLKEPWRCEGG